MIVLLIRLIVSYITISIIKVMMAITCLYYFSLTGLLLVLYRFIDTFNSGDELISQVQRQNYYLDLSKTS